MSLRASGMMRSTRSCCACLKRKTVACATTMSLITITSPNIRFLLCARTLVPTLGIRRHCQQHEPNAMFRSLYVSWLIIRSCLLFCAAWYLAVAKVLGAQSGNASYRLPGYNKRHRQQYSRYRKLDEAIRRWREAACETCGMNSTTQCGLTSVNWRNSNRMGKITIAIFTTEYVLYLPRGTE